MEQIDLIRGVMMTEEGGDGGGGGGGGGSHDIVHGTDSRESAFLLHDISSIDVLLTCC